MSGNETHTDQFGLVSGIRQSSSELILVAEPGTLFAPEARKGRLYVVTEAENVQTKERDACQLVTQTIRKTFYEDPSYSVTAGLRAAIRAANKALHQHNVGRDIQRRTHIGLTCAVIKGQDLFVAQVAPTQAYILTEGKLRALPAHPSWNAAHDSVTPFMKPQALGTSLFVEPELYRATITAGSVLAICSSNVAALLQPDETKQTLHADDPSTAIESLHTLCRQNGLTEAHALVVAVLPTLSVAAQNAPLSPGGLAERVFLGFRTMNDRFVAMLNNVALTMRGQHGNKPDAKAARLRRNVGDDAPPDPMHTLPEEPNLPVDPLPRPRPIDLGDELLERYKHEQPAPVEPSASARTRDTALEPPYEEEWALPPSAFLGEDMPADIASSHRRIDLSDASALKARARPYRPRQEIRPLVDMTWSERMALPFQKAGFALSDVMARMRRGRVARPAMPTVRGRGLSYRRQKPPFPWIPLVVMVLLVALLIVYGMDLSRRSAQQNVQDVLDEAGETMAAVYEAPDNTVALTRLEDVEQIIDQVRANPLVTETNAVVWSRYMQLQSEYERAQSELQRVTFFDEPTLLAEHPLPNGRFASVVVPAPTSGITDTTILEELDYIYALDADNETARLYRIPRDGGPAEAYLSPDETVQQSIVGPLRAQSWRVDNVVAVDEGVNGFGYYFRNAGAWNYTRLGGSEVWSLRGRLDLETYMGNLYVWGAQPGEVLRYLSGQYGNPPDLWLNPAGLDGRDVSASIDMAVDRSIYLLQPDGRTLVFSEGSFVREIVPEEITPPISAVTRFFMTGTTDQGWIFLLDTLNERVVQIDKTDGSVVQQMRVRSDEALRLNQLTDMFVDTSGTRPVLYLVNNNQIIQAVLPAPPRPFRQAETTPSPAP